MLKMKTGILTFHGSDNYGSVLQAYALVTYLNQKGIDAETVDYNFEHDYRQYKVFRTYKYKSSPKAFVSDCISFVPHLKRRYNFAAFRRNYLRLSPKKISEVEELSSITKDYDAFICGSDQIWNLDCTNGVNDAYFLRFADKDKLKIAYAPSIGSYSLIQEDKEKLRERLAEFDAISVRESSMLGVMEQIDSGLKAQVVLDPTMLLTAEDYKNELTAEPADGKYIFVYILGGSKAYADILAYAREAASQIGCKIRYIIDNNNGLQRLPGKDFSGCSPCDFLALLRDAEYVLTNSFHATVFSILFHKNFTSFERGASTGRITDLLDLVDLKQCFWSADRKQLNHVDCYENVDRILMQKREESGRFLMDLLNSVGAKQDG